MFKKAKVLKKPNDYSHAYEYALFLLNLSMRTVGEMREKMLKRGYNKEVVEKVIATLLDLRFLDDSNYTEVFINSMKNYKSWGRFMMKKKLIEKKLDKNLIEEKLEELVSEDDEIEIALRLLQTLMSSSGLRSKTRGSSVDSIRQSADRGNDIRENVTKLDYETKQKIMRRLAGRGFGMSVIQKIIR